MARISERVGAIAESATLAVDAKAKALKAAGEPVIGFGAGEPDFPTPGAHRRGGGRRLSQPEEPPLHAGGRPARAARRRSPPRRCATPATRSPPDILVTNGGKQAVYNPFDHLLNPGDEVLVPAPYWTTYPEPIALAGGVVVELPTDETQRLQGDGRPTRGGPHAAHQGAALRVALQPHRRGVPARGGRAAIGRWAAEHGIWVITDEIYEHLVYGDHEFSSIVARSPELADRCVILNGVAKTYAMTGWRVGWMIGPPDLIKAATNLQSHSTSNVSNVSQRAALAAVTGDLDAVAEMRAAFDRRRRTMWHAALGHRRRDLPRARRARSTRSRREGVLGRTVNGRKASTRELATMILDEAKVAVVPGEAFGAPGYFRLSFALGDDDLGEGVARIADLLGR